MVSCATIEDVFFESTENIIRMVFVIEGRHPEKGETGSSQTTVIRFDNLKILSDVENKLRGFPYGIASIQYQEGDNGVLKLTFTEKTAYVERLILPTVPPHPQKYRLILDIIPAGRTILLQPQVSKMVSSQEDVQRGIKWPTSNESVVLGTRNDVLSDVVPFEEYFYVKAVEAFKKGHYHRAFTLFEKYLNLGGLTHKVDALYGRAFSFYALHKGDEKNFGFDMIQLFNEALAMDASHDRSLEAKCIIGMTYYKLGVTKRAERIFEELKTAAQSDKARACAWKGLGLVKMESQIPVEAVSAFNEALKMETSDQEKKVELYFLLGKALTISGAYFEALKNLEMSLRMRPEFYLENPKILKVMGETLFGLQEYKAAQEILTWYLNLDPEASKDSIVWAEIAESLLQLNKTEIAERLQDKIIADMPDTEGAYIIMLRKAQLLEQRRAGEKRQAEMIYNELANKNVPLPLKEVTYFRWASLKREEGQREEALKILNRFLSNVSSSGQLDDFIVLKERILNELVLEKYQEKAYQKVVDLYGENRDAIGWQDSALEAIAVSYEQLEMYPHALKVYEELMRKKGQSDELFYTIARIAYSIGDLDKAERYVRAIRSPNLKQNQMKLLARIFMDREDFSAARRQLESLMKLGNPTIEVLDLYLQCLRALGDCERIITTADLALNREKEITKDVRYNILSSVLECHRKAGNVKRSIDVARKMVNAAPNEMTRCQTLYLLSSLYRQNNDVKQTELTLQELLQCQDPLWKKVAEQELAFTRLMDKSTGETMPQQQ